MKVMIAFATVEGQTEKIAGFVEEELRKNGHEVSVVKVTHEGQTPAFEDYDKVILAASVHERRHPKSFEVLLASQKEMLANKSTLLLSVSLKAAFEDGLEEAQDYVDEMKLRTGFEPDKEALVAGAVRSSSYDYFQSQVVTHVLLGEHGHDSGGREQEFTDWERLTSITKEFVEA